MKIFNALQAVDMPAKTASVFQLFHPASCPPYSLFRRPDGSPDVGALQSLAIAAQTSKEFFVLDYENPDSPIVVPDLIRAVKEVCSELDIGVFGWPALGPAAVHATQKPYAVKPWIDLVEKTMNLPIGVKYCPCLYSSGNASEDYATLALVAAMFNRPEPVCKPPCVFLSNRIAGRAGLPILTHDYLWGMMSAIESLGWEAVLWSNPTDTMFNLQTIISAANQFAKV